MKRPDILNDLITQLDRGDLKRGDLLPPLRSLADKYDTNPQTVANALTALVLLGRIHTTPRGSRVLVGAKRDYHLGFYRSKAPGQNPTSTRAWRAREGGNAVESPTRVEILGATPELSVLLGLNAGHAVAVRRRTRSVDGHPHQYKMTALPMEAASLVSPEGGQPPMLTSQEINPPAGKSIAQWLGMGVVRIEYRSSLVQADSEEAEALQMREGTPVLRVVSKGVRTDDSIAYATVTTTAANTDTVMVIETDA